MCIRDSPDALRAPTLGGLLAHGGLFACGEGVLRHTAVFSLLEACGDDGNADLILCLLYTSILEACLRQDV